MKRYKAVNLFTVVLFIIAGSTLFAGGTKEVKPFKELFEIKHYNGLNSDNFGVAESSLFLTLELKDRYPGEDYSNLLISLMNLQRMVQHYQ